MRIKFTYLKFDFLGTYFPRFYCFSSEAHFLVLNYFYKHYNQYWKVIVYQTQL